MKKNNFKSLMQAAVLICTPLVIASCDDVFGDVDNPVSSHISIKDAAVNLVLHADSTAKATYTRTAIAATGAQIEYSSTKPEIATVDAKTGKITAVNGGECEIIAKATGLDSRGNKTYQEEEVRFPVKVTDYRCRVEFEEAAATVNSADIDAQVFKLKSSEVYPKGCPVAITFAAKDGTTPQPISSIDNTTGVITLKPGVKDGVSIITVRINAADPSFDNKYEVKSNAVDDPDNPGSKAVMATFTLTVKEGVAYLEGYDATGKEIRKTMLKGEGAGEYINLSDKLMNAAKTSFVGTDVTLDAGWYYVDRNLSSFANNIRVKGDVNFILNDTWPLNLTKDLMDESAKQNYKLNFYSQRKSAANPEVGIAKFNIIKEFKDVNICGAYIQSSISAVENVTIANGYAYDLIGTETGSVEITKGSASAVSKFANVVLNKGTATESSAVWSLDNINTVNISEKANVWSTISNVTSLAINKAASIGNVSKVGTAVIAETPIKVLNEITDLTLNKVKTTGSAALNKIGAVTINKTDGTATFDASVSYPSVIVNALTISDGTIVVNTDIKGFTKTADADTKVTMTGGKLTVNGPSGTVFAILGDVEVSGGTFWACSPDHHAVSGALGGAFEGSTTGADDSWTAITGAERPKYIRNKKAE